MVLLADKYAAATTAAERASFVAGAEVLIALNDVPAVIGVLQRLGILLISLLMLKGPFARALAWLGVATGAIGVRLGGAPAGARLGVRALRRAAVRVAHLDRPCALEARDGDTARGDQKH
jgi:hypothetical protein